MLPPHRLSYDLWLKVLDPTLLLSENNGQENWLGVIQKYPGPEVINFFSCSSQFSIKFQILISINISRISACQAQISLECYFSGS